MHRLSQEKGFDFLSFLEAAPARWGWISLLQWRGPTHGWTGGGESTVRLSCKLSPLGPPLGACCFLPQVEASESLLPRRHTALSPFLSLTLRRQPLHSQSTEMEKVRCSLQHRFLSWLLLSFFLPNTARDFIHQEIVSICAAQFSLLMLML